MASIRQEVFIRTKQNNRRRLSTKEVMGKLDSLPTKRFGSSDVTTEKLAR